MNEPKILKFSAEWCAPCKALTEVLTKCKDLKYPVEEIDIDDIDNNELCEQYSIRSVPTLIIVDGDGTELKRSVGVLTEAGVMDLVDPEENTDGE